MAAEHWYSSGFANTDLDLQLKKHGIHKLIVMGLIAHTCVEPPLAMPPSSAMRSRWRKTRPRADSDEHMHASLEVNLPLYASAIVTTDEIVGSIAPHAGVKVGWEVEMRSTPEVVPDHLKCFAEQDIDGTLSDCSGDAVFVSAEERSAGSVPYEPYLKNCLAVRQTRFGNYVGSKRLVEGDYA